MLQCHLDPVVCGKSFVFCVHKTKNFSPKSSGTSFLHVNVPNAPTIYKLSS